MTPERWHQISRVLDEALSLQAAERSPYLDRVCCTDPEMRREVESLISSDQQAGSRFLNTPAINLKGAPADVNPVPTRVGRRIGVYDILEEIGHGGMGEVYRAVRADGQFTKQVAIKLVRGGFDTRSVVERFLNERQILASLDHPNIARLLDGGTTDEGVPYLVMELIEGVSIDAYCDAHRLSITLRVKLFRQVCAAVQYAHQRLVIHRDIKPNNILVGEEDGPKLLDFGIAKILDPSALRETTLARPMTPEYASPEQIRGETITTATDVYSLGVVLYQLLTGHSPYDADTHTPHQLEQAITDVEPGRPSTVILRTAEVPRDEQISQLTPELVSRTREGSPAKLRRRLAGDLDNIVLKALRKEPERRYASAEQFGEDLRRHLEGLPVSARQDSWSYRAGKFARRHKVAVMATVLVAVALMGGAIAILREARIAAANAQRAGRRFNDVRKLADSLLFELNDSIRGVPGTTTAQKQIVQRSLEYLDSLAQETSGDLALQRELATAYEKVGELQGDINSANLGDTQSAMASYRKSLAIRQGIAGAKASSVGDRVALGEILRRICGLQLQAFGDVASALQSCQQAIAVTEVAVNSDPTNRSAREELIQDYRNLGVVHSGGGTGANMNDPEASLQNARKALDLAEKLAVEVPSDVGAKRLVAVLHTLNGEDLLKLGDRAQALNEYQEARAIFEQQAKDPANTGARRNFAIIHRYVGDVLLLDGKFSEARSAYEKEVQLTHAIADADPKDMQGRMFAAGANVNLGYCLVEMNHLQEGIARLNLSLGKMRELVKISGAHEIRTNIALNEVFLGEAYQHLGNTTAALQHYLQALEIYSAIVAANPNDAGTRVNLAELHDRFGSVYVKAGNTTKAAAEYRQALDIADSLASANPRNVEALYALADTYAGLGDVSAATARNTPNREERSRKSAEAQDWYMKSVSTWQKVPNPARISPKGFEVGDPQQAARSLAETKARLANSSP